jgi:hypothetical protein
MKGIYYYRKNTNYTQPYNNVMPMATQMHTAKIERRITEKRKV